MMSHIGGVGRGRAKGARTYEWLSPEQQEPAEVLACTVSGCT